MRVFIVVCLLWGVYNTFALEQDAALTSTSATWLRSLFLPPGDGWKFEIFG